MADAHSTLETLLLVVGWTDVMGRGMGWRAWPSPAPFGGKMHHFWNSRFGHVLTPFLELSRGVERAGEPLIMSICTHYPDGLGEADTAYPFQILLPQCREIVDTANATDGSMGARQVHAGELGGYRFRLTPSTSDAEARPRPPTCARLSRHAKNVTMLLLSPENGFESQANKG